MNAQWSVLLVHRDTILSLDSNLLIVGLAVLCEQLLTLLMQVCVFCVVIVCALNLGSCLQQLI